MLYNTLTSLHWLCSLSASSDPSIRFCRGTIWADGTRHCGRLARSKLLDTARGFGLFFLIISGVSERRFFSEPKGMESDCGSGILSGIFIGLSPTVNCRTGCSRLLRRPIIGDVSGDGLWVVSTGGPFARIISLPGEPFMTVRRRPNVM